MKCRRLPPAGSRTAGVKGLAPQGFEGSNPGWVHTGLVPSTQEVRGWVAREALSHVDFEITGTCVEIAAA